MGRRHCGEVSAWKVNSANLALTEFSEGGLEESNYHSFEGCAPCYERVSYFCNMARSGYFALVKEASAMRDGHLLKRAGREFVRNLIWMAVVFGSLAAILATVTDLSLVEVMGLRWRLCNRYGGYRDGGGALERGPR